VLGVVLVFLKEEDGIRDWSVTGVQTCALPISVMMIDMDGLKAINDHHGHLFGAHSIGEVGRLLGREIGAQGVACRFGGDEFCLRSEERRVGKECKVRWAARA